MIGNCKAKRYILCIIILKLLFGCVMIVHFQAQKYNFISNYTNFSAKIFLYNPPAGASL